MLYPNQYLKIREEEVAAKVIDGEAIIINLANGIYYSIDKTGAFIWEMIQSGHSIGDTISSVVARYDILYEKAEKDVQSLVNELLKENLVCISNHAVQKPGNDWQPPEQKLPYDSPKLNIYRDMGDLLALDPPTPGLGDMTWKNTGEDLLE